MIVKKFTFATLESNIGPFLAAEVHRHTITLYSFQLHFAPVATQLPPVF